MGQGTQELCVEMVHSGVSIQGQRSVRVTCVLGEVRIGDVSVRVMRMKTDLAIMGVQTLGGGGGGPAEGGRRAHDLTLRNLRVRGQAEVGGVRRKLRRERPRGTHCHGPRRGGRFKERANKPVRGHLEAKGGEAQGVTVQVSWRWFSQARNFTGGRCHTMS